MYREKEGCIYEQEGRCLLKKLPLLRRDFVVSVSGFESVSHFENPWKNVNVNCTVTGINEKARRSRAFGIQWWCCFKYGRINAPADDFTVAPCKPFYLLFSGKKYFSYQQQRERRQPQPQLFLRRRQPQPESIPSLLDIMELPVLTLKEKVTGTKPVTLPSMPWSPEQELPSQLLSHILNVSISTGLLPALQLMHEGVFWWKRNRY